MPEPTCLQIAVDRGVAIVSLARPEVRNAFNETMVAELTAAFDALGDDPGVSAIVLAAQGPVFCAGADLDWMARMAEYSFDQNRADARALARMMRTLAECPRPVIARVHGDTYAGGMGLVAACDIALAVPAARFCLSETRLGLIPATIGPYVVAAIGARAARRYMLTAERFDAAEAYRLGLVHELVEPEALDERVAHLLDALLEASGEAVQAAKRLVRDLAGRPVDDELMVETANRIALVRASEDGREGVRAFLERRPPRWVVERQLAARAADEADPAG